MKIASVYIGCCVSALLAAPVPFTLLRAAQTQLRASSNAVASGRPAAAKPDAAVTYNRDVAPIIYQYCSSCHRPGEAGPFPLITYDDVKKHARQIVAVTQSHFMPPWLPDQQELKFADERRLSPAQIEVFRRWVDAGTPEGRKEDLPPKPQLVQGWQLGKPDLVIQAEKPFMLPAEGGDRWWNFILPVPITQTRWVKAIEIRPGDKRLVHHANMYVDRLRSSREREIAPGAGFGGMEMRIESETFDPDSHFLFWKPGTVPYVEPDGMALRLDPGNDLLLNTHLQPSGKEEAVQPSIGIYFTDRPATQHPMLLEMENDAALHIPAHEKEFVVSDSFTLPEDVDLLAIYPHAHYLGRDLQADVKFPSGETRTLIHIRRWDVNWQAVYRYAKPVRLPAGTVITFRYTYDNSEDNVANPNHPPKQVNGGNGATDEMAHLWLQVLPVGSGDHDPRMLLQEALSRHEVEKDPGNFEAQFNLAAMLQARGEVTSALDHYAAALQLRPKDAVVNNAYGGALLQTGKVSEAIARFQAALQARPAYFDAHYNLGNALAAQGDFSAAAQQFSEAVALNPHDAGAQTNLGSALAQLGRLAEAKTHFEQALKINPNYQLARENLQQVEGMIAQQH